MSATTDLMWIEALYIIAACAAKLVMSRRASPNLTIHDQLHRGNHMQGCFFDSEPAMGMTIVMIAIALTPGCSTTPKAGRARFSPMAGSHGLVRQQRLRPRSSARPLGRLHRLSR